VSSTKATEWDGSEGDVKGLEDLVLFRTPFYLGAWRSEKLESSLTRNHKGRDRERGPIGGEVTKYRAHTRRDQKSAREQGL